MINIYKDNITKEVTKGAYKSFYKRLGYKSLEDSKKKVETSHDDAKEKSKESPKINKQMEQDKKDSGK